jgi:hypothetical protein
VPKKDAAGNVVRYKARLVAQGFSQVPGVDYFDTFAPVARLASIRTVLAFAAAEDYETGQIDIKGAYLNGELTNDKVIYMKQPPGYSVSDPKWETPRLSSSKNPLWVETVWKEVVPEVGRDHGQAGILKGVRLIRLCSFGEEKKTYHRVGSC